MQIITTNLTKRYKNQLVLNQWSFSIQSGQRIALMGESGCGKTTFLRILMQLEQPDSGTIEGLQGVRVSAVFQQARLCPTLTALENVLLVAEKSQNQQQKAKLFLEQLGLDTTAQNKRVGKLSGGQRQRVAIARALMVPFDILLLDEAFKGLDPENQSKAISLVLEQTQQKMLLAVTHDTKEAEQLNAVICKM